MKKYLTIYRRFNISIEIVHVPELNDFKEIEELAKWIFTNLDSEIELIIDPYIPIPELNYREPNLEEKVKVYNHARK